MLQNFEDIMLSEISAITVDRYCLIHVYGVCRVVPGPNRDSKFPVKIMESESRMAVVRGWGEREKESWFLMDIEFQFYNMKNF